MSDWTRADRGGTQQQWLRIFDRSSLPHSSLSLSKVRESRERKAGRAATVEGVT